MAISRRAFVGGSAAAVGAAVASPNIAGAQESDSLPTPEEAAALGATPFLVQAVDPQNARFEILIGEDAVPFTDKKLARTLARLAEESR